MHKLGVRAAQGLSLVEFVHSSEELGASREILNVLLCSQQNVPVLGWLQKQPGTSGRFFFSPFSRTFCRKSL